MRNPERISYILGRIRELWEQHPDWRFGQLLFNTLDGLWDTPEPYFFYLEEEELDEIIERRMEDWRVDP